MLELRDIALTCGHTPVLHRFNLRVTAGERIGILGPSGAGKSSLLKLVAGLLTPSDGTLHSRFQHPVLVFQEPRLLPWCTVRRNIALPLRAAGRTADEARQAADDWLSRVGLAGYGDAWPRQLSGGMAQRAALARAFALSPDLLLLDEPFSALDPGLRALLGELCLDGLARTGAALLCVSHHPHELVGLVDRCLLLHQGTAREFSLGARTDIAGRTIMAQQLEHALLHCPTESSS